MIDFVRVGNKISEYRKNLNMTQDELARKANYTSRSSINKIELGQVDIPQSKITAIAEALGVTVVTVSKALSDKEGVGELIKIGIKNNRAIFSQIIKDFRTINGIYWLIIKHPIHKRY